MEINWNKIIKNGARVNLKLIVAGYIYNINNKLFKYRYIKYIIYIVYIDFRNERGISIILLIPLLDRNKNPSS